MRSIPFPLVLFLTAALASAGCDRHEVALESEQLAARAEPLVGVVSAQDGVPIVYQELGAGETAVVFVHCWACDRAFWQHQVEPVAQAGYRVVTLDLPGHGDSGAARQSWTLAGLAADVQAVADELGLEEMSLVGHSMGGPVSLLAARSMTGRVLGIVCVDTLHDVEFQWPEGMTERMAASLEEDFGGMMQQFVGQLFQSDADPELVRWVLERAEDSDHRATVALMRAFADWEAPVALAEAGVPVRCINAAPADGRGLATAVQTNRKYADYDAVVMEGVGHYPQLEQPNTFNSHLIDALEELAGGQ